MRAISLWQPWASLMAYGFKTVETRGYPTNVRGKVAIHAAKQQVGPIDWGKDFDWVMDIYARVGVFPLGFVLCTVDLIDCVPAEQIRDQLSDMELAFGNYADGRFAWVTANAVLFDKPIPAKGKQSFWEWEEA